MSNKYHLSLKTKKILLGIGIGFGTVVVFFVSFFLAFSFIVNPITVMPVSDADTEKENKELKTQVQTLEDEVELLNTTLEKYRSSASAPQTVTSAVTTTVNQSKETPKAEQSDTTKRDSSSSENNSEASNAGGTSAKSEGTHSNKKEDEADGQVQKKSSSDSAETVSGSGFTPETVTTPETGIEVEPDEPIMVIDVSE